MSTEPVNPFLRLLDEPADVSQALVPTQSAQLDAPITGGEMEVLFRLGRGLARSGMFKDAKQADQAFAKLIFGRDLGLSVTQAMTDIHIVEGKPEMSANLQAGKVRSSERYEYRVLELTNERCEIAFTMDGEELQPTSVFSIEDAKCAGLVHKTKNGHDGMWEKYPRNMLFARAMSNGVAFHCPDVMNGIRVYAEGELVDVQRVERPGPAAEQEPEDATVVADGDALLNEDQVAELVGAFDAAGADIEMFLTAVGLESTDDITASAAYRLREKLGEHLQAVTQ